MDANSLISRIKVGDRKAFGSLFRIYRPILTSYAMLFMKNEWAEDVVQDVFFNLWQHRENLDAEGSIHGYLLRSTYNTSINYLSKRKHDIKYRSWYQQRIDEIAFDVYDPSTNDIIRKIYSED
ncbi:MAG: RNA polymerase sigma-70 factor, partial [Bacteroidales bacterium]|nr:RNA polymerase sigma-70 factor [Bacteroidales bacterium]